MTDNETIIYCSECGHRFESRRSKTGYACEVWGYDDFACDVPLNGYCFKAKPKYEINKPAIKISDIQKGE